MLFAPGEDVRDMLRSDTGASIASTVSLGASAMAWTHDERRTAYRNRTQCREAQKNKQRAQRNRFRVLCLR